MVLLMPTDRRGLQAFVVAGAGVFHQPLQADVAAQYPPAAIEQQQGEQPANAPIAIRERMNAEEVEQSEWNP